MQPFSISEDARRLLGVYPDPEVLRRALKSLSSEEKLGFLRLWVSEGIPYAFRDVPMLYEKLRGYIGSYLFVHPRSITVVGSGRIGYSLSQTPDFGKSFGQHSDLDIGLVDSEVFLQLCKEFETWRQDFDIGTISPKNQSEKRYWEGSMSSLPKKISRGFLDSDKIPTLFRYKTAQRMGQLRFLLSRKIEITPEAPQFRRNHPISFSVYKSWESFLGRLEFNLQRTIKSFPTT